jgi:hypothetical protein
LLSIVKIPIFWHPLKVAMRLFRTIEIQDEKQYIEDYVYVSLSYVFEVEEIKDRDKTTKTI